MKSQGFFSNLFNRWFTKPPVDSPVNPPIDPPVTPPESDHIHQLLALHNGARRYPLSLNDQLHVAAQKHAEWMARNNKMSHEGEGFSSFWTRIKKAGYNPQTGGENVAMGYPTVTAVFKGWMNSRGHHANIVNSSYKEVGFGVATSKNGSKYWCANFGTQMNSNNTTDLIEEWLPGPLFNPE